MGLRIAVTAIQSRAEHAATAVNDKACEVEGFGGVVVELDVVPFDKSGFQDIQNGNTHWFGKVIYQEGTRDGQ